MISTGLNLVMTVIGFSVSTMFIVFVCTRLVCARIHFNTSRRSFPVASRSDLGLLERGLHGLEPVVVANFPTKKYSDEYFSASEDAQYVVSFIVEFFNVLDFICPSPILFYIVKAYITLCVDKMCYMVRGLSLLFLACTVCLAEFHGEDILRILPYCGHSFHVTCIDIWLQQHSTCPVCRISLREFPERKRLMQPLFSSAVRSHYSVESFNGRSYPCLATGNGFPRRTHGNRERGPTQGGQFSPEGDRAEAGENVSPLTEGNQIIKGSETKHVESPSNP
ncbi:putative ring-h2 finger protein atl49 [Quercus suber]|uniref:Ring-h2 finger protein atl49 n=1 Tax=Quercus suber TaxID=58331 RepID=A0AAW0M3L5_QUESU